MQIHFNDHFNLQVYNINFSWKTWYLGVRGVPDNKVMRVNLSSTAAVQQDARVSHNGTAPVMLVLHGGHSWQKTVEVL